MDHDDALRFSDSRLVLLADVVYDDIRRSRTSANTIRRLPLVMPAAVDRQKRLPSSDADPGQTCPDAGEDSAPVFPSRIAVLCILAILAVLAYWCFVMIAMSETQPGFTNFFDR